MNQIISSALLLGLVAFGDAAIAGQYRITFDTDAPVDIRITTEALLSPIDGFTERIISVSGTDGSHSIIGLYPLGSSSDIWGDSSVAVDNLFNFLGGDVPGQLSSNGFAYITEPVSTLLGLKSEVYRFYYGKKKSEPSTPDAYQGIFCIVDPTSSVPPFPDCSPPGVPLDPRNVKFTPGPLPLAGAAMAFGFSRKLRLRIRAGKEIS
jgi:hypothetical protein